MKTFAINGFYDLGVIQAAGSIEPIGISRRYRYFAAFALRHSFQAFVMSEALPTKESGFTLTDEGAKTRAEPTKNPKTFKKLRRAAAKMFRRAGYFTLSPPLEANFHNVGTARMGNDPAESVVNSYGKAHDVDGLFLVDSTVLPTSGAVNSGLTIAAVALRAAGAALPS